MASSMLDHARRASTQGRPAKHRTPPPRVVVRDRSVDPQWFCSRDDLGTPYRDPNTDYEALLVLRNAPRWLRKLQQFDILVRNADGTCSVSLAGSTTTGGTSHRTDIAIPRVALGGTGSPERPFGAASPVEPQRPRTRPPVAISRDAFPSPQEWCVRAPREFRGKTRRRAEPYGGCITRPRQLPRINLCLRAKQDMALWMHRRVG